MPRVTPQKITVIGSFRRHMPQVTEAVTTLQQHHQVLSPQSLQVIDGQSEFVLLACDTGLALKPIQDRVLRQIDRSDLVYWVNPDGYVGTSAAFEMGYAIARGVPVYAWERPHDITLPHYLAGWCSPADLVQRLVG